MIYVNEKINRDIIKLWREKYNIKFDKFITLELKKISIEHQANVYNSAEELSDEKKTLLRSKLEGFRQFFNETDPFIFYSKYYFANEVLLKKDINEENLKLFLSDRCFYFSEYRDTGNLIIKNSKSYNAPSLKELLCDEYFEIFKTAERKPEELIRRALNKIDKPSSASTLKADVVHNMKKYLNPSPKVNISVDDILKPLKKRNDFEEKEQGLKKILQPYEYELEQNRIINEVLESEWIPTKAHEKFYNQLNKNYEILSDAIENRKNLLFKSNYIVRKINKMSNGLLTEESKNRQFIYTSDDKNITIFNKVIEIFEVYIRSLLHKIRNCEYMGILTSVDMPMENKKYAKAINRLIAICDKDNSFDELTPLFLYLAFSQNTKVVLSDNKPKMLKKISVVKTPAKVEKMASMVGYRAGINLVLYQKLKQAFCLGKESNKICDFGFALLSGYGFLYHHNGMIEQDIDFLNYDDIYKTNDKNDSVINETEKYPVYRYIPNYLKPVGELENILKNYVKNCIPNYPQFLTPINATDNNKPELLDSKYQELSLILLQDLHLPSMQRVYLMIKKLLSQDTSYIDQYKEIISVPILKDKNSRIAELLKRFINQYSLKNLVMRYGTYSISGRGYNINTALMNIVEYEILARILDNLYPRLFELVNEKFKNELLYGSCIFEKKG